MDIGSWGDYPANALSNFSPNPFEIDGVQCNSMEGFLQSLKFKSEEMQIEVCKLVGKKAKFKGKDKNWWHSQKLWWRGVEMDRHGKEYQELLDRAFNALSENTSFRKALLSTREATLTYSMGKSDPSQTVLTTKEFCGRLTKIRTRLQAEEK